MMIDLGKYEYTVLISWGACLFLLLVLVAVTLWQGRRVKAALARQEARMHDIRRQNTPMQDSREESHNG
ncbi:heme exporter protein CcmD [Thioclava sp. GXIMD4216]|uniref:Heme exporter protein D n=1 Tax=Thioclava litoralis TaxID=3076557 RepID=A0ABZ1E1B7_9RHOB|nr:heme exporter protein CcmD [Thioclava sp. FTW29]